MTAVDLLIRGARLLTCAPLRAERPRIGPAAGDVGAVEDGWVAARGGAGAAAGRGGRGGRGERGPPPVGGAAGGRGGMAGVVDPPTHPS